MKQYFDEKILSGNNPKKIWELIKIFLLRNSSIGNMRGTQILVVFYYWKREWVRNLIVKYVFCRWAWSFSEDTTWWPWKCPAVTRATSGCCSGSPSMPDTPSTSAWRLASSSTRRARSRLPSTSFPASGHTSLRELFASWCLFLVGGISVRVGAAA